MDTFAFLAEEHARIERELSALKPPRSRAERGGFRMVRSDLCELLHIEAQTYSEIFEPGSPADAYVAEFASGRQRVEQALDVLCGRGEPEEGATEAALEAVFDSLRDEIRHLFRMTEEKLFGPARARLTQLG